MKRVIGSAVMICVGLFLSGMVCGETVSVVIPPGGGDRQTIEGISVIESYGAFVIAEVDRTAIPRLVSRGCVVSPLDTDYITIGNGMTIPARTETSLLHDDTAGEFPGLVIVQFARPIKQEWLERIERKGDIQRIRSACFTPFALLYHVATRESLDSLAALPAVRWVGPYRPPHKIAMNLAKKQSGVCKARIKVIRNAGVARIADLLSSKGVRVLSATDAVHYLDSPSIVAEIDVRDLLRIATVPEIFWIEEIAPMELTLETARELHQRGVGNGCAGDVSEVPVWSAGITGAGGAPSCSLTAGTEQLIGIIDTSFNSPDFDCASGIPNCTVFNYVEYNTTAASPCDIYNSVPNCLTGNYHGTASAGVMLGNGSQSGGETPVEACAYKGLAFGARMWTVRCEGAGSTLNCLNYCHDGDYTITLESFFQASFADGSRTSNNSWTAPVAGAYDGASEVIDIWAWDNDNDPATGPVQEYLWFFSAGNDGPGVSTIGSPATAKNDVSGAAFYNGADGVCNSSSKCTDTAPCAENKLVCYSSRGPTLDGRYGPDVAGASHFVQTPANAAGYLSFSGTSCASPALTAQGALIRDWLQHVHSIAAPGANLIKALLLNSGEYLGSPAEDLPAPGQGWGRPNMTLLCDDWTRPECNAVRSLWREGAFTASGQATPIDFYVNSSATPLRLLLTWMDPPNLAGGGALVNNLDLRLTAPDGTTVYLGNDFTGGWSDSGGLAFDSTNNVEGIRVPSPQAGKWTLEILSGNIVLSPQPWAVVLSGVVSDQSSDGWIAMNEEGYNCGATVWISVADDDLRGMLTLNVTISSTTEAAVETISLTEQPADSGKFAGPITLTAAPAVTGDGLLSVGHGDTITAFYLDADDGLGGTNVLTQDAAFTDCVGPVISNIAVPDAMLTDTSAVITWDTDEPATSTVHWGVTPPPLSTVSSVYYTIAHGETLSGLFECGTWFFSVESCDVYGNCSIEDNGNSFFSVQSKRNPIRSYVAGDTPVPIPDATVITSTIHVAEEFAIGDIDVNLTITHPYVSDLIITLIAPDMTRVALASLRGGSGDNYTDTTFDDEAAMAIADGSAPFSGSFRPEQPLAALDGRSMAGDWALEVSDTVSGNAGTLESWGLRFSVDQFCDHHVSMWGVDTIDDLCQVGGGHDGVWDPGEEISFSLTIINDGEEAQSGIEASLTCPTAGVTIVDGSASLDDMAAGQRGTTVAPHFTIQLPITLDCGETVAFEVALSTNESVQSVTFSHLIGEYTPACTMSPCAIVPDEVSPVGSELPLRVIRDEVNCPSGFCLLFSGEPNARGYHVYEGVIGDFYSHENAAGTVCDATVEEDGSGLRHSLTPSAGDRYYVVTAFNEFGEGTAGSAGRDAQCSCLP